MSAAWNRERHAARLAHYRELEQLYTQVAQLQTQIGRTYAELERIYTEELNDQPGEHSYRVLAQITADDARSAHAEAHDLNRRAVSYRQVVASGEADAEEVEQ